MPLKIIGGQFKGLVLKAPPGQSTRPTSSRVREAVFSVLGQERLLGAKVLDLFAGSGAMGLEALSRGADKVLLCDSSLKALTTIKANLEKLPKGLDVKTLKAVFPGSLPRLSPYKPFSLVFVDPPYQGDVSLVLAFLAFAVQNELLVPGSQVVWEQPPENLDKWSAPEPWRLVQTKRWGDKCAAFLELPDAAVEGQTGEKRTEEGQAEEGQTELGQAMEGQADERDDKDV
ncbi:MAG: 16S rRNA (guanine(966)-N(2))-methyltransferase RsmD [Deltaproteobacteria bacterium]|jgi:16S rRNA (guanine(966)-N(2))-methyltransferase RsmD|nr:16S rRNA (guanine(966)-N(2))-methyltransferase RsmD [Deltaproteobacteria bacterium]